MNELLDLAIVYALPMSRFLAFISTVLTLYGGVCALIHQHRAGETSRGYVAVVVVQNLFLLALLLYFVRALFFEPVLAEPATMEAIFVNVFISAYLLVSLSVRSTRIQDYYKL